MGLRSVRQTAAGSDDDQHEKRGRQDRAAHSCGEQEQMGQDGADHGARQQDRACERGPRHDHQQPSDDLHRSGEVPEPLAEANLGEERDPVRAAPGEYLLVPDADEDERDAEPERPFNRVERHRGGFAGALLGQRHGSVDLTLNEAGLSRVRSELRAAGFVRAIPLVGLSMGFQRHHSAFLVASVITVASFISATAYTQNRLTRLDDLSATLETNAVPTLEILSRLALRLTRLGQKLDEVTGGRTRRTEVLGIVMTDVRAIEDDLASYLRLPPLPGERDFLEALRAAVSRALGEVKSALAIETARKPGGSTADWATVNSSLDAAVRGVVAALEYDVTQSRVMARDVRDVRMTRQRTIMRLDALASGIALVAVAIAHRASRRHDNLLHEHSALLSARVSELDRFAGRVAHDILSPLGTIGLALSMLSRSADAETQTYIGRSRRALQRVQQLVEALLTFARSGARPDRTAACSADAVLADAVADCSHAAAARGIELVLDTDRPLPAACALGVIASIAQNLLRNAITYMGSRPVRRIVVRGRAREAMIRIEVEDTGPGISLDVQSTIFQPFVRGGRETSGGIGLGLATVKRLAEAHGGAAGLHSTVGVGTVFWVELPVPSDRGRSSAIS